MRISKVVEQCRFEDKILNVLRRRLDRWAQSRDHDLIELVGGREDLLASACPPRSGVELKKHEQLCVVAFVPNCDTKKNERHRRFFAQNIGSLRGHIDQGMLSCASCVMDHGRLVTVYTNVDAMLVRIVLQLASLHLPNSALLLVDVPFSRRFVTLLLENELLLLLFFLEALLQIRKLNLLFFATLRVSYESLSVGTS